MGKKGSPTMSIERAGAGKKAGGYAATNHARVRGRGERQRPGTRPNFLKRLKERREARARMISGWCDEARQYVDELAESLVKRQEEEESNVPSGQ